MLSHDDFGAHLRQGLHSMGLLELLPEACIDQLWTYFTELGKWGRKMNLVAQAPDLEILESHFLDSLSLLPELDAGPLLDVGSGAGFPGLCLKIARPELAVTLVEPRQKRVNFLRHLVRTLGLGQVEVLEERLIADDPGFRAAHGQFPLITSRAVAEIDPFLTLVAALCPPQGRVLCMKGPKAEEEIALWRRHSPASPFLLDGQRCLRLPFSGANRTLVLFRKQPPPS